MSNLTKITDELMAVVVPLHSKSIYISKNVIEQYFLTYVDDIIHIKDLDSNYEILGTVSETEIDFDCEPYTNATGLMAKYWFLNTLKSKGINPTPETKIVILKKI